MTKQVSFPGDAGYNEPRIDINNFRGYNFVPAGRSDAIIGNGNKDPEITRMTSITFLFVDYLETEEKFQQCEKFWDNEFLRISHELVVADDWFSFGTSGNHLRDGTFISAVALAHDFNALTTILRKVSTKHAKVLTVTQLNASKFDVSRIHPNYQFIEHSVEVLPLETGLTEGNVRVMHIRVLLTENSLVGVQNLIREWIATPDNPTG